MLENGTSYAKKAVFLYRTLYLAVMLPRRYRFARTHASCVTQCRHMRFGATPVQP
jgi:hypothetical protein